MRGVGNLLDSLTTGNRTVFPGLPGSLSLARSARLTVTAHFPEILYEHTETIPC